MISPLFQEYNLTVATIEISVFLFVTFLLGITLGWILRGFSGGKMSLKEEKKEEAQEIPEKEKDILHVPIELAASKKKEKFGDDFTQIYGITDDIESLLNKHKIFTYKDIVEADIEGLEEILLGAAKKFHKISPVTWPDQAKLIDDSQWRELEEYQRILKKAEKNKAS